MNITMYFSFRVCFPQYFRQRFIKVIPELTKSYVYSKLIATTSATFIAHLITIKFGGGGVDAMWTNISIANRDPHSPSLITQNTRLSQPVIGRVLTNMFSKRTQMPHAIHAGRFSRLHFLEHHYTFVGDDYWWHRYRSIQRSQMARDCNYTDAPINYYQAVCHPHETINSVAPVHRRADKLSRSAAHASPRAYTCVCLFFFMYIFSFSNIRGVI